MQTKTLTLRQQRFIFEYLNCMNAAKSARNAGYSVKTARAAGHRLLTNVYIKSAIERGLDEQMHRARVSSDKIIGEIGRVAFSDYPDTTGVRKMRALELLGKNMGLFAETPAQHKRRFCASDLLVGHK